MDEDCTFEDYQSEADEGGPSTGQQTHQYDIEALRADMEAIDTELRNGFQHVHTWMKSVDAQMQGMANWIQGMDVHLQSIDASMQMMLSWMHSSQKGNVSGTGPSGGLGDAVPPST